MTENTYEKRERAQSADFPFSTDEPNRDRATSRSTLLKAPHLNITLTLKNNAVRSVSDRDVAPPRAASDGARELGELRFRDPRLPLLLTRWILNAGFGALRRLVPRDARAAPSTYSEIVHIQGGQCGNQIGAKFWEVRARAERSRRGGL